MGLLLLKSSFSCYCNNSVIKRPGCFLCINRLRKVLITKDFFLSSCNEKLPMIDYISIIPNPLYLFLKSANTCSNQHSFCFLYIQKMFFSCAKNYSLSVFPVKKRVMYSSGEIQIQARSTPFFGFYSLVVWFFVNFVAFVLSFEL